MSNQTNADILEAHQDNCENCKHTEKEVWKTESEEIIGEDPADNLPEFANK